MSEEYLKKGQARVTIKTKQDDELPSLELNMLFTKGSAIKLLIYAIELKAKEEEAS